MITESPMTTVPLFNLEADHCLNITAAKTQLKDIEKAVEMMHQIIKKQNILIDGGFIEPHTIKPTMDGLKKAEDALAEATKRVWQFIQDVIQVYPGCLRPGLQLLQIDKITPEDMDIEHLMPNPYENYDSDVSELSDSEDDEWKDDQNDIVWEDSSILAVFVCTAFDSLQWLDRTANIKAILLSELVFDKIMEEGLVQQIQEANYLLQSVLYGIQELGEHEPNLSSLLSFGVHYSGKLNEAITETMVKKKDKLKKEAFKSAIQKIIGKNIGQRHKKDVVIKDLPPLIRLKQKEDSSLLDIEPNDNIGLCNLFSDNQNSC
ncbi:uncharacterized protein CDAR_484341 [Caerostris darwini]|uniref:Uncharacterized protein n=1 Tax=Caerostris darwini TaxID=1538125 RepID=A0AAV4MUM8_9ARAC|nr:uncharacterized protein CDAR_484341 [Caerostris darwini]